MDELTIAATSLAWSSTGLHHSGPWLRSPLPLAFEAATKRYGVVQLPGGLRIEAILMELPGAAREWEFFIVNSESGRRIRAYGRGVGLA